MVWFHDVSAGSVHRQVWPTTAELGDARGADPAVLSAVGEALTGVRKAKSDGKVGMRAEIASMTLAGSWRQLGRVRYAESDLRSAGRISDLTTWSRSRRPHSPSATPTSCRRSPAAG